MCLRASPIIKTRLTLLRAYTPLPSSISALAPLSCLVLCCYNWKRRYLCFVCVLQSTIHPRLSLSFLSFVLPHKAVLHAFFDSFILSHWLHCYLYNHFATTFSDFLNIPPFNSNNTTEVKTKARKASIDEGKGAWARRYILMLGKALRRLGT